MTRSLCVEADVNAVDTRTNVTGQGSVAAPSRKVPAGVSKIAKIIVAVGADLAAAGSAVWIIRLGGSAVMGGEQVIVVGAGGGAAPQAGSDQAVHHAETFILEDADIDVKPDIISIDAEMDGSDLGDSSVVVTLIFA